jgi:hypothetical protein
VKYLLVIYLFILSSCVTLDSQAKFDSAEAAYINETGNTTINGRSFITRKDGVVVYAAGSDIALIPTSAYAINRVGQIFKEQKSVNINEVNGKFFEVSEPEYVKFQKIVKADDQGRFTFKNIATGNYFVFTTITWNAGDKAQASALVEKVTATADEQTIELTINGN